MHKSSNRNGHYNLEKDFKDIRAALTHASNDVRGRLSEIIMQSANDVKNKTYDAKDAVADYIVEKPFKSIGIAILTGFVLGFLFRRK